MNMNSKKLYVLILATILASCSSGPVVPTTDVCSVEKHYEDSIYQVKINGKKINNHWYLKEDAIEITQMLARRNKCMR